MVFLDLPFQERARRIADLGFEVELWDWTTKDLDALTRTGVVGLEAWASGDPVRALERFRAAFTLPAPP
jgi:hydroxypyruvate isomerase